MLRLAVAVLGAAGAGLGVSGSAQAATCGSANGVSVVVDFHQLGGGVQTACDAGGAGRTAYAQLKDVGHRLDDVQRTPGFICRIDDLPSPADDPCVNTPPSDAYWSVWWSDGTSGAWTFSSQGAGSLTVPEGGYVALSWQSGNAKAPPRVKARSHARSSPTTQPTSQPTSKPSSHPAQSPTTTAPASPSTSPPSSGDGKHSHRAKPSKSAKPHHHETKNPGDQAVGSVAGVASGGGGGSGSASDGLPGWVAPVAIAVLFVGAGTIVVARRRSSGGG